MQYPFKSNTDPTSVEWDSVSRGQFALDCVQNGSNWAWVMPIFSLFSVSMIQHSLIQLSVD